MGTPWIFQSFWIYFKDPHNRQSATTTDEHKHLSKCNVINAMVYKKFDIYLVSVVLEAIWGMNVPAHVVFDTKDSDLRNKV